MWYVSHIARWKTRTMRIEISKKYAFAIRRNWSHKDFGSHVYQVYLVVVILLAA